MSKQPLFGNGKICYLEIPAGDIFTSAEFYKNVFGWEIRDNNEGQTSFNDGVGEVSGTWVTGRKPATEAGIMISIMVDVLDITCMLVETHGGTIVQRAPDHAKEKTAAFKDPFGNLLTLYQHGE